MGERDSAHLRLKASLLREVVVLGGLDLILDLLRSRRASGSLGELILEGLLLGVKGSGERLLLLCVVRVVCVDLRARACAEDQIRLRRCFSVSGYRLLLATGTDHEFLPGVVSHRCEVRRVDGSLRGVAGACEVGVADLQKVRRSLSNTRFNTADRAGFTRKTTLTIEWGNICDTTAEPFSHEPPPSEQHRIRAKPHLKKLARLLREGKET